MVVSQFSILLDNPEAVYLAGQSVTGKLVLVVAIDSESFESINMECTGITNVKFNHQKYYTEMDPLGNPISITKTTFYRTLDEHFKLSHLPLLETNASDGHLKFNVGQYICPFSFTLPNSFPSSVEGEHGYIRYALSAQLKRTEEVKKMKDDEHCNLNISFNNLVDLNLNPVAKMPAKGTASKNIGNWHCFGGGPVTAQAWMNQSGCAPGQILYFNANVDNLSGKTMMGSTVQLIQEISYHARGEREASIRIIRNESHGAFGASDVWDNVPFLIPHVAPSDEHLSKHIKVSYRIEFTVYPGISKGSKLTIPLDVIIGNIPVNSSVVPITDIPTEVLESTAILSVGDAPPRHEDCFLAGSSAVMDDDGTASSGFTPRYVTFARANTADDAPLAE